MPESRLTRLLVELGLKDDKLKKGLSNSESQLKGFGNQIKKIGLAIAGAFSIRAIARFGKEIHMMAGEAEGVEQAFKRLDQPNLLKDLQKATRGTVSNLNLMKYAVRAENFKVPLTQLATFFEFATKRAAQTGESVDYLVESIITGIGRKSVLVMDNLGISAAELQKEVAKVGDFGEAAGNIIQRELGKAGDVILTSAQRTEQLRSAWSNLMVELGKGTKPIDKGKEGFTALINLLTENREAANKLNKATKEEGNTINWFTKLIIRWGTAIEGWGKKKKEQLAAIENSTENIEEEEEEIKKEIITITKLKEKLDGLKKEKAELNIQDEKGIQNKQIEIQQLERQIKRLEELGSSQKAIEFLNKVQKELEGMYEKLGEPKIYDPLDEMMQMVEDDNEKMTREIEAGMNRIQEKQDEVNEGYRLMAESAMIAGEAFVSSFQEAQGGVENLKDSVLSSISKEIQAYIAKAIAGAMASTLATIPPPMNLILAGAAGAAAGSLIKSAIPSFAGEGVFNKDMIVRGGDYAGVASNPEFMLKQSTLKELMGGSRTEIIPRRMGGDIIWEVFDYHNDNRKNRGMKHYGL